MNRRETQEHSPWLLIRGEVGIATGKTAYYALRWVSTRGQKGPWSFGRGGDRGGVMFAEGRDTMGCIMLINGVNFPMDTIADFCRRHGVARLSLFGSILRDPSPEGGYGFRPTSDVDMLVEFLPGRVPSLLRFAGMQMEVSELLGREVQLCTPSMLSRYFRDAVLDEARLLHAA